MLAFADGCEPTANFLNRNLPTNLSRKRSLVTAIFIVTYLEFKNDYSVQICGLFKCN